MGAAPAAIACSAQAQASISEADGQTRISYNIPSQSLSGALALYARQSNLRVLFPADLLDGQSAPQVRGIYTRDEALRLLFSRSHFSGAIDGQAIQVQDRTRPQSPDNAADPATTRGGESGNGQANAPGDLDAENIVVTGTRIRGAHPAGANLISIDRDAITHSGRTTLQDVLATAPQSFPGSQSEISELGAGDSGRNLGFGSTVDLRGLGADATLTLLNGRRLAPSGWGNFVDISIIPLSAVARVEILADGASATYGSDAVAGVVNVILRRDFDGAETSVRYGGASRGEPSEWGASQLFGKTWDGGNAMAGFEYRQRSALAAADRSFSASSNFTDRGGSDFSSIFAYPGNILQIGATPTLLAIPRGQDGTSLSEADLIFGVPNERPFNDGNSLLPSQQSWSGFGSLRQDLNERLSFNADFIGAQRKAEADRFQVDAFMMVPETNYYRQLDNLFPGQGPLLMAYNLGGDLGPTHYHTRTDAYTFDAGLNYDLGKGWALNGEASYSNAREHVVQSNIFDPNSAAFANALASNDPTTAFNPFGSGGGTPPSVLAALTYSDIFTSLSQLDGEGVKADGPVFALPGGDARVALGAERRHESFELRHDQAGSLSLSENLVPSSARTTNALFGELFLPLVSADNRLPGVEALNVSLSVRREDANDYGAATTPKAGLSWLIGDGLTLRGTWGRSFKAPQFQQLLGSTVGVIMVVPAALDPQATNGSTGLLYLGGANPNLKPERGETWTAGFDFAPPNLTGFDVSATYFNIDFSNRISVPGDLVSALANGAGYEGILIRNPSAQQISDYLAFANTVYGSTPPDGIEAVFDGRLRNLASLRVRGIDLHGGYQHDTAFGTLSFTLDGSTLLQYAQQNGGQTKSLDTLDTLFHPVDWRVRAAVDWRRDGWDANLAANYTADYTDNLSTPARRIAAQTLWDLRLARDWRASPHDKGFELALEVQNLFDANPPFVNNPIGYAFDAQTASPVGRTITLGVTRTW
jgi:outer membrane cobalamin receptor